MMSEINKMVGHPTASVIKLKKDKELYAATILLSKIDIELGDHILFKRHLSKLGEPKGWRVIKTRAGPNKNSYYATLPEGMTFEKSERIFISKIFQPGDIKKIELYLNMLLPSFNIGDYNRNKEEMYKVIVEKIALLKLEEQELKDEQSRIN